MKIVIAGGTGMLGTAIIQLLQRAGHKCYILSRRKSNQENIIFWDPEGLHVDAEKLPETDILMNVSGENIGARPWTNQRIKKLTSSRVRSNIYLKELIEAGHLRPKRYISASAVGYYGNRPNELLDETSGPGKSGILPNICIPWERSINSLKTDKIKVCIFRIGILLSPNGGALKELLPFASRGLYLYFGSGKQIVPWIHVHDAANAFCQATDNAFPEGIYNLAAPGQVSSKEFASELKSTMGKIGICLGIPALAINLVKGKMRELVMDSAELDVSKLRETGFTYAFPELHSALGNLVQNN